jgi:hypothetical protein
MLKLPDRLMDVFWPWGRIKRLRAALAQSMADTDTLRQRLDALTDRDERGRFKK